MKTITWRFSHLSWRRVKKADKTEELSMAQQKKTSPRHIMRESPFAESAWQLGTFFEKRCFYPDK
jgi:hypothetical protein